MTAPLFRKATRTAQKLKIGITGPSGAGKSLGALALAQQLAGSGKVAVIDTENGSASLYADRYQFDTLDIAPPYRTVKYVEAVAAAVAAGYEVIVIDSISHQWDGDGGILQRKEETDARGGNHFSNWQPFTKEHNEFRAMLLHAPAHIIATMRSKMAYSQEEGGKKQVKKVGLQPIQRDGMEYEFTLTFDVQMDHKASASKDRTGLFTGKLTDILSPSTGKALLAWLATAEPLAEIPKASGAISGISPTPSAAPDTSETESTSSEALAEIVGLLPTLAANQQAFIREKMADGVEPEALLPAVRQQAAKRKAAAIRDAVDAAS